MAGFYENITVSAAVPNAAADAEAAKDAAVTAKNEAEAAKDAAEVAKNLAEQHKDTASGYVGTVSGAQSIADANVASTAGDKQAAEDARDLALEYRNTAQSASTAATNAVGQVSANAATVAGMSSKIDAVYDVRTDITDVANNLTGSNTIGAVAPYVNQINTVSGITTEIVAVNADAADIGAVATDLTGSNNIGTVAGLAPKINTVAGLSSELTTVHGNNADITTVANSLNAGNVIANVSSSIGNVNNVGNKLAEIEAVKNALSDIAAVENKLTEIDSVSDSITNVDSVAGVISEVQTVAGISSDVTNLSASTGNMATLVSKLDQTTDLAGAVTDAQNSATSAASSASTASTHATTASGHATTAATHAANLGSVAYQNLTAIAESKSVTAKDVFVYDTSKDSDGGAWRHRTQGTSWYNEALNTSTRGATKKFPAVAVVVAEPTKVTIYDADDPSMPMWMEFQRNTGDILDFNQGTGLGGSTIKTVTALNGTVFVALGDSGNGQSVRFIEFTSDTAYRISDSARGGKRGYNGNIEQRNDGKNGYTIDSSISLVNLSVNDVAVTVLPHAPIDAETGLPVPTIAVATAGGVSVIKDDGSVYDVGASNFGFNSVEFRGNLLFTSNLASGGHTRIFEVDKINADWVLPLKLYEYAQPPYLTQRSTWSSGRKALPTRDNEFAQLTNNNKLTLVGMDLQNVGGTTTGKFGDLAAYVSSSYNTGWMNGDIKLATLMDTTAENISAPELVTNGDFSSFGNNLVSSTTQSGTIPYQGSPWRSHSGSGQFSISNNVITVNASTFEAIRYDITTSNNKAYKITFDLTRTSGDVTVYTHGGAPDFTIANINTSGTHTVYYTNDGTQPATALQFATSNLVGTLSNFKVEEVTGWFSNSGDSTSGLPSLEVNSSGQLEILSQADDYGGARQYVNLTKGKTYNLKLTVVSCTNPAQIRLGLGTASSSFSGSPSDIANSGDIGIGTHNITFVCGVEGSGVHLYIGGRNDITSLVVDNISLTKAEPDRSVNNNGLNIVGNVTKSAVATGAELVGYGGFSSSNYLEQPYNSDLDFGTGDFCVMGWVKVDSSVTSYRMFERNHSTVPDYNKRLIVNISSGNVLGYVGNTNISGAVSTGEWTNVCFLRSNGIIKLYVNGLLVNTASANNNLDLTDSVIRLGQGVQYMSGADHDIALWRISATAPTAEQIAKIYRDEKPLFQEGAKCTLSGKDDVQAIAYDEDTGKLHVGNGDATSGRYRDEFVGLQNVNPVFRDTYSIGTAISAVNGLVVEE